MPIIQKKPLSANEGIKTRSNYLRGDLAEDLADLTRGNISADNEQLIKFHGSYMQDDRDIRSERRVQKLDKAYSFMIRVRVPGGVTTPHQWLEMDRMSDDYANGTIKLTTRQAYQLHGVIKSNLKQTIKEINDTAMDTIAACGDVNRNVMCNPNPEFSSVHAIASKVATDINTHLTPQTGAYHEIWLDGEKVVSSEECEEPIYGKTYLPRKFKIAVAVPPSNDVDVNANCLSFIAIVENGVCVGFNIAVGGGMGMTHGMENTFPRVADVIGFVTVDQAVEAAEAVVKVQRDYGNREDRKLSRLKYTVEVHGAEWFKDKVNQYLGWDMQEARPFEFTSNGDRFGWVEDEEGRHHFTLFVQGGRVLDTDDYKLREGLREIAKIHDGDFRLTANQNIQIARISPENKPKVEALLESYNMASQNNATGMRLNSIACVSLPTCSLALTEAERYLPSVITELEETLEKAGLNDDEIVIRMTGCPNGCGRPFLAEIAMVGRGPNAYNIYLGGGFAGQRLNKLYKESVPSEHLVNTLAPIIWDYSVHREEGEHFGDFVIRSGYVEATENGADFHLNIKDKAFN